MPENLEPQNIQGIKCYAPDMAYDGNDYPIEAFERLVELEDKNFWFRSRNQILIRIFRKYVRSAGRPRVLEIGCGTGYVLSGLESENRYDLVGGELHINGLIFAKQRLSGIEFIQMDARKIHRYDICQFDAIGAFDVLEHIEEDTEVIRPGGLLLCDNVEQNPAFFDLSRAVEGEPLVLQSFASATRRWEHGLLFRNKRR